MESSTFTVVRTTRSPDEADNLIDALRKAGLHPLELVHTPYLSLAGTDFSFPIEVPAPEADKARQLLKSYDRPRWAEFSPAC